MMPPSEISQKPSKWLRCLRVHIKAPGLDAATALLVLILSIHWLVERAGGVWGAPELFIQGGLSWSGVQGGKIWQMLSYALLHASWGHLLVNALMLWVLGARVIHLLGCRAWMKIVLLSVFVGGSLHLVTAGVMEWNGFQGLRLVGISGVCYALLLTLITLSPELKMWPIPVKGKVLGLSLILCEMLLWLMRPELGIPVLSELGQYLIGWGGGALFELSHACHFGGALVGWWLARKFSTPMPSLQDLQRMRAEREARFSADDEG